MKSARWRTVAVLAAGLVWGWGGMAAYGVEGAVSHRMEGGDGEGRVSELRIRVGADTEEAYRKKHGRSAAMRKVSGALSDRLEGGAGRRAAAEGGREMLDCNVRGAVGEGLSEWLEWLGCEVVSVSARYGAVHARIPAWRLEEVAADARVESVREVRPVRFLKTNTSEGDVAHRAKAARNTYGVTGAGVKVGVMSDSEKGLASLQASGDLPRDVAVVASGLGGTPNRGEGTAMMEIVHDLAPGASLCFATVGPSLSVTSEEAAERYWALFNAGCRVLVDDMLFADELAFSEEAFEAATREITAAGGICVSSAGNNGNDGAAVVAGTELIVANSWEGDWKGSGVMLKLDGEMYELHEFSNGAVFNRLSWNTGMGKCEFLLDWSDPGRASANDYDLILLFTKDSSAQPFVMQAFVQEGAGCVPLEYWTIPDMDLLPYLMEEDGWWPNLAIVKKQGAEARRLRVRADSTAVMFENHTPGHVYGHGGGERVISAGGVRAPSSGSFAGGEAAAYYSSDGPRRLYHAFDGTPYTPGNLLGSGGKVLEKPDFAAATEVSCATPGFEMFPGTSASAPHLAAIVALMLEANPDLDRDGVFEILKAGTFGGAHAWNRTKGWGIPDAETCVRLAKESRPAAKTQTVTFDATGGECSVAEKEYTIGGKYGWLPTASKYSVADWMNGISHVFLGWYTAMEGGARVTEESPVTDAETRTLYAHWKTSQTVTVIFAGNGGTPESQNKGYTVGEVYGEFPAVSWAHHSFAGWYTESEGGTKVSEGDKVDAKWTHLYAHWNADPSQTVTFDANGGSCSTASETYPIGSPYGWLPRATWTGHEFLGWFTAGGTQIRATNVVGTATALTLLAHWAENDGVFWITGVSGGAENGGRMVRFRGVTGHTYQLQRAEALGEKWEWTGEPVRAEGDEVTVPIPGSMAAGTEFYRLAQGGEAPAERYMVVDMGGGAAAKSWSVGYTNKIPAGGWPEECKGTKMVLRWVDAGTFKMGSPTNELGRGAWASDERQHSVTLTDGFWIGVFEVTQRQWTLAVGGNPSKYQGDFRPVDSVSYNQIRGAGTGTNWPASGKVDSDSFLGVLRAKTGLEFDLPTEAQWEYACRAGTTTALNSGKDLTDTDTCPNLAELGRYTRNWKDGKGGYSSYQTTVGSYLPNAWGLYDMHGNLSEWCLDWEASSVSSAAVTNPAGPASGSRRIQRGGDWQCEAQYCRSAERDSWVPGSASSRYGFRVACSAGP